MSLFLILYKRIPALFFVILYSLFKSDCILAKSLVDVIKYVLWKKVQAATHSNTQSILKKNLKSLVNICVKMSTKSMTRKLKLFSKFRQKLLMAWKKLSLIMKEKTNQHG